MVQRPANSAPPIQKSMNLPIPPRYSGSPSELNSSNYAQSNTWVPTWMPTSTLIIKLCLRAALWMAGQASGVSP